LPDQDVRTSLVDITKNAQFDEFEFLIKSVQLEVTIKTYFKYSKVKEAAGLINKAKTIYCFFGQIILGQAEEN
jgi:hypothetical protein